MEETLTEAEIFEKEELEQKEALKKMGIEKVEKERELQDEDILIEEVRINWSLVDYKIYEKSFKSHNSDRRCFDILCTILKYISLHEKVDWSIASHLMHHWDWGLMN